MKLWALFVLAAFLPSASLALPAVITTGEHSDFTRLVVTLPEPSDWRLGRVADGYTLSVDQQDLQYDLTKAFTRIAKTRIADVGQVPATSDLHIVAGCACYVTAFAFRPNVIVVDIKAGAPSAESPFEVPLVSFAPANANPPQPAVTALPTPTVIPLDWTQRAENIVEAEKPVADTATRLPAGFRETIVQQLGAAASQGLVKLDTEKADQEETVAKDSPPQPEPSPEASFRVITEAGMDMRVGGDLDETPPLQEKCLPAEAVDIAAWGKSGDDPMESLSAIHRMLVTDADRLADSQLADAARQYLYLGFGAEARLTLASVQSPAQLEQALSDIGHIIDGAQLAESAFTGMEACTGPAALWAVLARDHLRLSEPVAAGAIVQAFAALPLHLREALASRLIDRFLESGDETTAHMIRDTISRATEQIPPAMQMAEARLELHENRPEQAKAALQAASALPGPDEAAALVALIDMDFAARTAVGADRIAMLETLAAQNRGQDIEADLRRSLVLAYALSGEFALSHDALQNAPAAAGDFWALMAESGAEADILDLAFSPPPNLAAIDSASSLMIAQKLHALGFPQQALQWLGMPRNDVATLPDAARLTIAEAQLALFQPREAIAAISGLDAQANPLRARAMRALGRPEEAVALLQANPASSEDLAVLQRTERQWEAVAAQPEGAWAGAAGLALESNTPLPDAGPVTLAGASAVAAKAGESRELLGALLQETQLAAPPP